MRDILEVGRETDEIINPQSKENTRKGSLN